MPTYFKSKDSHKADKNDKLLFAKLDSQSQPLRQSANDMIVALTSMQSQPKEFVSLTEALSNLSKIKIEEMDKAIKKIKREFLLLTIKVDKHPALFKSIAETELENIINKYNVFVEAAVNLTKAAFDLVSTELK